jgi:murein DD-endopeptidase MepM/ murein hydrolase activator NlpD
MNIFGEGFPDEIQKQIKYRQEVYGSGYASATSRTNEQILYLNSNTSWCKLVSGVDISSSAQINNPTIKNLGLSDNELAQKFVLFNGTQDENGNGLREGISSVNDILAGEAYGIGGTSFGIRPMMGIQNASIKHENKGSLRRAQVKIKAFNRAQFEIIDALYLRLGYSVLLEWGHSIIIDNKGSIETNPVGISLSDEFLSGNYTSDEFLQKIYDQRLINGGNYDAMLAKVANFSWSFLPDGSYDITVYLSSIGDLIESLKVNILTDSPGTNNSIGGFPPISQGDSDVFETDVAGDIIEAFAYSSTIGNFLYMCKTLQDINPSRKTSKGGAASLVLNVSSNPTVHDSVKNDPNKGILKFDLTKFELDKEDALQITFDDLGGKWLPGSDDIKYYVRLGTFLKFLQLYITPTYYNKKNKTNCALNFDTDENSNLMNVNPLQVSVDPRICYVNRSMDVTDTSGTAQTLIFGIDSPVNPFINDIVTKGINKQDILYGNIMNIYLESTFILKKIIELRDDQGNLSLIDFLKGLLNGINEGLGGLNNLDVFIDETNNTIKIIDQNPLNEIESVIPIINSNFPGAQVYNNNKPLNSINTSEVLELYGYNTNKAGFISDFGLTTELTPAFSTMITAGAAARGTVVGENDTALSKLNKGFSDRFKVAISNNFDSGSAADNAKDYAAKKEEFDRMKSDFIQFLVKLSLFNPSEQVYVEAEDKDIQNFKTVLPSLVQKSIEVDRANTLANNVNLPDQYQGTGFIPFNMNLTMNGLSGIKINQQFLMNTNFLPTNYPDTLKFLVKNLSHEISNNKWVTKIETYSVPKAVNSSTGRSVLTENNTVKKSPSGGGGGSGSTTKTTGNFDDYLDYNKFVYPTTTSAGSPVGPRTQPAGPNKGKTKYHNGYDLGGKVGDPIYSACDGTVLKVGASGFGSYALLVKIDPSCYKNKSGNPIFIWYGHNSKNYVKKGDTIKQGQLIAAIGNEGWSTGPHLHFEIYSGKSSGSKSVIINPVKYFGPKGTSLIAKQPFTQK